MRKTPLILSLALLVVLVQSTNAHGTGIPSYYPSGPQTSVAKQTLFDGGWTLCWEQGMGQSDTLENIYASCTGDYILYAGGVTNTDSYMLVAAGPRSTVFSQTGYNETIEANGTYWYLNPNQSMGFAPSATISQSSADVRDTSDPLRMSWHTGWCGSGYICGGWRVGASVGLNNDNGYTRAIWHSGGGGFVAQPAVSQEEYDSLKAQYDQLVLDYANLEAELATASASLTALQQEYDDYVAWATGAIDEYKNTIDSKNATIADQESAINSYKITIDNKNETIAGYINKVDSLNEALAAKEKAIDELTSQLKNANETIDLLKASLDEANGKVKTTEEQLAAALETLAKSKSDYELEKAKSADLNKQLIAAQARIKELETKLAEVQKKLDDMTAKQGTTQKQLEDAQAEIETLVKQLKDANATIAEQKSKIEQLQAIANNPKAEQNLALAEEITEIALAKFEVAEKDSEEYEVALAMLAVAAEADDPDLPEELAALPVVGAVAEQVLEVMNDLGNIGADIAPEQRERAEEIVVASVIAGNIAVSAGASAPSGARRKV